MMLLINELRKLKESDWWISGVLDDNSISFTISVEQLDPALRSMRLLGISVDEKVRLMNAIEFRAFANIFWRIADGEIVQLPVELHSDWKP